MADLTALALAAANELTAAELHGAVCALAACEGAEAAASDTLVGDLVALLGVDALTDQAALEAFIDASIEDLRHEDLSFAPLLPGDDAPLPARLEALGDWCGSFLAGLAAGLARRGAASLEDCPEQVREIVRDFAAIAQVDAQASGFGAEDADADNAESDLTEIEEFVKVGTLLISSTFEHEADDSTR